MCGIAGIIDPRSAPGTDAEAVRRMCDAMRHRGPDDDGLAELPGAVLGMRRLAIFDPANGHQPMQTPEGRVTVVFNGAIYNHRELRGELEASGWNFRTCCDTEVLLAAYARWGEACLAKLRGMFAFAAWDKSTESLFLARDAFGIKPLYYRQDGARLAFASELNALAAGGAVVDGICPIAVADYLAWLAVPAPRTIYRGIFSLRPGECATFRNGNLNVRTWWSFGGIPPAAPPCRSREEFTRELRARLEDSIRAHLLADVPVGAFLSGGMDSAAVVGLMSKAGGARLRTFSIGFDESEFSEAEAAAQTARHFGTDHHATTLSGAQFAQDVEGFLATLDQPTGDGINTWYASRAARTGGAVAALSGLGGDELLGGYPSFREVPRIARWRPRWRALPGGVRNLILRRLDGGDTRQRKLADILRHATDVHEIASLQRRVFSQAGQCSLLSSDAWAQISADSPFHPALPGLSAELAGMDMYGVISGWELRTYMADVLLRDSDVMSMARSLELRVPFIDRPLIEWLWHQPAEFKITPQRPKSVLAEALHDVLPGHVGRTPKRGFSLPMDAWMKRELRPFLDEIFSNSSLARSGLFNRQAVHELWQNYVAGNDSKAWSRVWSLAMLIGFVNRRTRQESHTVPGTLGVVVSTEAPPPCRFDVAGATSNRSLVLAPEMFSSEGGIPRILQTYLRALCELAEPAGAVRLLALNDPAIDAADRTRCANGRLEAWSACNRSKSRFVREALRMSRGCDRILCGHIGQLPVAWMAKRLNPKLRYYVVAHGIEVWRSYSVVERVALRGAERIFCVSDFTRREVLKGCPLPEGRAVVLHNALDPSFTIEPGRPLRECPPVILTVTRLSFEDRYKGIEHLIAAMPAILRDIPDARLRIIGRGNDLARLQALRRQLGLGDSVDFTGFVDEQRLAEEMRSCRLFALPSNAEGFGLVFLEAMARGRPCLGARAGGAPEIITPETGVLVEYGDTSQIAAACVAMMRRDWDQEAILMRAREFAFPEFKQRLSSLLAA